jgi:hypothetical protein
VDSKTLDHMISSMDGACPSFKYPVADTCRKEAETEMGELKNSYVEASSRRAANLNSGATWLIQA